MKKLIYILSILIVFACNKKAETKPITSEKQIVAEKDSVPVAVDTDKDPHGCEHSTGYAWSELKSACVRVSETGTKLRPYPYREEETGVAYVIFDGDQAELFLPTEKSSLPLTRESEGMPFVGGDWQLIPWKGYVLKKGKEIRFTGE